VRFKEQKNYFAFLNILKIDTSGKFDKTFWDIIYASGSTTRAKTQSNTPIVV
jgi:hypothetical protein